MQLFRIAPEQYLENFSGLGGSYEHGGRWNRPGQPALYMALSAGAALLEMANYLPSPTMAPPGYRLGVYELDDDAAIEHLGATSLPEGWWHFPYPEATQRIGGQFLDQGQSLALTAPSVCAPLQLERIALINPGHPDLRKLKLRTSTDQLFNPRIFSNR